jgi:hypothetical protein
MDRALPPTGSERSVHISAFVPTDGVVLENDAVNASQVPFTELHLPPIRGDQVHRIEAPILLCVQAENGTDPNPCIYVQDRDADDVVRGTAELIWLWDGIPDKPCKWRVFDLKLPLLVFGGGVYTFGVYASPDDPTEAALASYPLPIILDAEGQLPFMGVLPPHQ